MKKIIIFLALLNIFSILIMAQEAPPQAFSYKATIINTRSGAIVASKPVALRISILQGDSQGFTVYSEIFNISTNEYGQIDILIGKGNVLSGNFMDIPWSKNIYFLKTEVDIKAGTDFQLMSISQLLSVPYSFYSAQSGSALSADYNSLSNKPTKLSQFNNDLGYLTIETDPVFSIHPAHEISFEMISNWNTSYSWGNHALQGYAYTDSVYSKLDLKTTGRSEVNWDNLTQKPQFANVALSGSYEDLIHTPEIPTSLNQLIPDAGNRTVTNVAAPVSANDAATKAYVDELEKRIKSIEKAIEKLDPYGIPVDADGNTYDTVKIGKQVWMKQSLKSTKYQNGDSIDYAPVSDWRYLTKGSYSYYNNSIENYNTYGALYNWMAVNDSRKICPTGWRVPNEGDWAVLVSYLGGEQIAGLKLKEAGTAHWLSQNQGTNESGFTALPGGVHTATIYTGLGQFFAMWLSHEIDTTFAHANRMNVQSTSSTIVKDAKYVGYQVRCIKGELENLPVPTVMTNTVSGITSTSAIAGGAVSCSSYIEIISKGICFSLRSNPGLYDSKIVNGSGVGSFTNTINIQAGRTYYVRAYAITPSGVVYGNEVSFTSAPGVPVVSTYPADVNTIKITSAVLKGSVGNDSGSPVTSRGICWNTIGNPTISDNKTIEGSGVGIYQSNITGLQPETKYYYRAYATNNIGTGYGQVINFMTKTAEISIITKSVFSITQTTANTGGIITNNNDITILEQGVCWRKDTIPILGISESMTSPIMDTFNLTLNDLEPASTYYVRAYLKTQSQTIYGLPVVFATNPVVISNNPVSVSGKSAVVSGTIQPGTNVIEYGSCWGTTPGPTISGYKTTNCSGDTVFTCNISNLQPNTNYYVRTYIINNSGLYYGNEVSFRTSPGLPKADTVLVSSITTTSANLSSGIINDGGATLFQRGFCWSTSHNPDTSGTKVQIFDWNLPFTTTLSNLNPATRYYVRSYVTSNYGINYSNEISLLTGEDLLSLKTYPISNYTATTAQTGGYVHNWSTFRFNYAERGVCWNTSPSPEVTNFKTNQEILTTDTATIGEAWYYCSISGLNSNTLYYVRAYLIDRNRNIYYGDEVRYTSPGIPTSDSVRISSVTSNSAILTSRLISDGRYPVVEGGFCWSTAPDPTRADSKVMVNIWAPEFSSEISGLNPSTKYYVRSYFYNGIGTGYSETKSFITLPGPLPSFDSVEVISVGANFVSVKGSVTNQGGSSVVENGFCWNTAPAPTISNSKGMTGAGTGIFSANLSGFVPLTTYYLRMYAINNNGVGYSKEVSFRTSEHQASVLTYEVSGIGTITAQCGGFIRNYSASLISERGICWNTSPFSTINNFKNSQEIWTDTATVGAPWYQCTMTGLTPNTQYYVRAYIIDQYGTHYGDEKSFVTLGGLAVIDSARVSSVTINSVLATSSILGDGGIPVTQRGFCWGTEPDPTVSNSKKSVGSGVGSFSTTITGLTPSTTYYIRSYAMNSTGVVYGSGGSFRTTDITIFTYDVTLIGTGTAQSGGYGNNASSAIEKGICWNTSPFPDITNYKNSQAIVFDTASCYGLNCTWHRNMLTGLSPNTQYYVRAYLIDQYGTHYGDEKSFVTLGGLAVLDSARVSSVTINSVLVTSSITSDGGAPVTERGFCWGTQPYPTIINTRISVGSGIGYFSATLTGLISATTYYIRSYAVNSYGVSYGSGKSFRISSASIVTWDITGIGTSTALSGGYIRSATSITEKGICWSTLPFPEITNYKTSQIMYYDTASLGPWYQCRLTDLSPNTRYYVRAYIIDQYGTHYGDEKSFVTLEGLALIEIPSVSLKEVIVTSSNIFGGITPVRDQEFLYAEISLQNKRSLFKRKSEV